jgi:hypothetical protein
MFLALYTVDEVGMANLLCSLSDILCCSENNVCCHDLTLNFIFSRNTTPVEVGGQDECSTLRGN